LTTLTVELAPPVFQALSRYPYYVIFFSTIPFSVILWKYPICPQNADENAIASYNKECERYLNRLRWGALGFAIGLLFLFTTTVEIHNEEIKREKNNLEKKSEKLESDQKKLESDQKTLESDQKKLESDQKTLESDQKKLESDQKKLESDQKTLESDQKKLESDQKKLESDKKELKSKPREVFLQAANCMSPSFVYLENDTGYAVKVYTKHTLDPFGLFSPRIYEIQPHQSQVVAGNLFSSLAGQGMWVSVGDSPAIFLNHGEIIEVSKLLKT
jgi:hypothetical protein